MRPSSIVVRILALVTDSSQDSGHFEDQGIHQPDAPRYNALNLDACPLGRTLCSR